MNHGQDLSVTNDRLRPVIDQAAVMSLYVILLSRRSMHEMLLATIAPFFCVAKWNVRIATKAG